MAALAKRISSRGLCAFAAATALVAPLFLNLPNASLHAEAMVATDASKPLYSEVVRESLYVPVRDGTKLAVNIYRPAVNGKAVETKHPVVFVFTPYRARFKNAEGKIEETGLSPRLGLKGLTDYGYVVVAADIRGKGASFGSRRGFQDRTEANDGYDLIQWLAAQSWSTGKVGMTGCSYLGGTTVQTATTAPPALKAIFTGASDYDKYMFVRRGGITAQFNTRPDEPLSDDLMSIPVDADKDGTLLKDAVAQHAKNTPMAPLWYGMPFRDSVSEYTGNKFWEEVGPYTYADKLKKSGIAFYFWGNWQDEPTEQMMIASANLGGRLLIGPGSHCVPAPGFDFSGEVRRFFDLNLKGVDTGMAKAPRFTWWVDEAAEGRQWVKGNTLPGSGIVRTPFYLAGGKSGTAPSVNDGMLASIRPGKGQDSFTVNYDVGGIEYFAFWPQPLDSKGLTFTGVTLDRDVQMLGSPVIRLTLSSDRSEARIFAYLEDVAPDGTVTVVSHGRLAASYRKEAKAPYDVLGLPWHSALKADAMPLAPGKPVAMNFPLLPASRIFKAGHRLRVTLTGADPRQRNLNELKENPPPRITIERGASLIELPIIRKK